MKKTMSATVGEPRLAASLALALLMQWATELSMGDRTCYFVPGSHIAGRARCLVRNGHTAIAHPPFE